mgnify:CR=1 FL=1
MDSPAPGKNSNFQRDKLMAQIHFDDLLSIGAHFGHVVRKWNPNFQPYILMEKNGIHIINLEETIKNLEKTILFINDLITKNGEILFVGTKKQAKDIVQQEADKCGMFYVVERWLGGTLTNYSTIKKSIKRLQLLEKEGSSIYENLTKKELQMLNRERIKLSDQHRGIKDMKRLPDAIIIVDANFESIAVNEANLLEIPIIAIVDSNTDPRNIDYPIPANDDSIRTIQLIISTLSDAVIEARNKKEEDVENKDMETELSPAEDEKPKMKKEESSEDSISEVSAEAKTSKVEVADENIEKTAKKERAKKPSIKTKAEKEPVSNIEKQVESKKKDDSPIESENEEN